MDFAFTDEMIRRDREELSTKALEYVRSYSGDFGPLLAARRTLDAGYPLNVGQLRLILNAMRTDTSVVFNYQPPEGTTTNVIAFRPRRFVPFGLDDEDEEVKPQKAEPRWYKHDFKLKLPYGMATSVRSEVLHLMSQERSELHYHPIGSWHNGKKVFNQPIWEFRLYYECTQASKKLQMMTEAEAQVLVDHGLMRFCRTCQQFREMRG